MHAFARLCTRVHASVCTLTYVCTRMHAHVCALTYGCLRMHAYVCTLMHAYAPFTPLLCTPAHASQRGARSGCSRTFCYDGLPHAFERIFTPMHRLELHPRCARCAAIHHGVASDPDVLVCFRTLHPCYHGLMHEAATPTPYSPCPCAGSSYTRGLPRFFLLFPFTPSPCLGLHRLPSAGHPIGGSVGKRPPSAVLLTCLEPPF